MCCTLWMCRTNGSLACTRLGSRHTRTGGSLPEVGAPRLEFGTAADNEGPPPLLLPVSELLDDEDAEADRSSLLEPDRSELTPGNEMDFSIL
jgi:hypothetical protein